MSRPPKNDKIKADVESTCVLVVPDPQEAGDVTPRSNNPVLQSPNGGLSPSSGDILRHRRPSRSPLLVYGRQVNHRANTFSNNSAPIITSSFQIYINGHITKSVSLNPETRLVNYLIPADEFDRLN